MERFLCSQEGENGVKYIIKWTGLPVTKATFQPYEDHVPGAAEMLKRFHSQHTDSIRDQMIKANEKPRRSS